MTFTENSDMVIGFHYGSVVYTDIDSQEITIKMYLDGIMAVRKSNFDKWTVEIRHKFVDRNSNNRKGLMEISGTRVRNDVKNDLLYLPVD